MDFVRVHACHQHTISTVNRNCRPCARRLLATRRSWYSRNSERRLLRRTITVHRPCDRITRVTVLLVTRALHLRGLVRLASTRPLWNDREDIWCSYWRSRIICSFLEIISVVEFRCKDSFFKSTCGSYGEIVT